MAKHKRVRRTCNLIGEVFITEKSLKRKTYI
jgi:hypothetical protein